MHYVYVLKNQQNKVYIGCTKDLRQRVSEHNSGKVSYTNRYKPWRVIYYEAYSTKKLAFKREQSLKHHAKSLIMLKKRIGLGEG